MVLAEGPQLFVEDSAGMACRDCGRRHAPSLVGLLDLARTAERIGKIGRHTVAPPMVALLDLARVAEDYLFTKTDHGRRRSA
jgi:hypothetical protein